MSDYGKGYTDFPYAPPPARPRAPWLPLLRGLALWRFSRFGRDFAVNATRWLYLSNHAYSGEQRFYLRVGKRPGHVFRFGGRRV